MSKQKSTTNFLYIKDASWGGVFYSSDYQKIFN